MPGRWINYLSEAYERHSSDPNLELKVVTININEGYNQELMKQCRILREYAQYVKKVREYAEKRPLNAAVKQAVDDCIQEGILENFLRTNRAEVIAVSIFEYNKEEEELKLRKAEYEAGITEGEARLSTLITLLLNDGKEAEIQQVLTNPVFREEMYKKYGKF